MPRQFAVLSSLEKASSCPLLLTTVSSPSGTSPHPHTLTETTPTHRSSEVKGSAAVASFTCEQEVTSSWVSVAMGTVCVVALTVEGVLHFFKYPLTNQIAAPISAHSLVQFTTDSVEVSVCYVMMCVCVEVMCISLQESTPSPLPVLAVSLSEDGVTVAHGSPFKPAIETLVS